MTRWLELARDSRKAANLLLVEQCFRASISRAYYAVYSKVTHELHANGVSMPTNREGPSHARLRAMIEGNLYDLSREKREALSRMVGELYAMRVAADYLPSTAVTASDNREALSIMKKTFEAF